MQSPVLVRSHGEADIVAMAPNNSLLYYWAPRPADGRTRRLPLIAIVRVAR
jgi:hypothetical protein